MKVVKLFKRRQTKLVDLRLVLLDGAAVRKGSVAKAAVFESNLAFFKFHSETITNKTHCGKSNSQKKGTWLFSGLEIAANLRAELEIAHTAYNKYVAYF